MDKVRKSVDINQDALKKLQIAAIYDEELNNLLGIDGINESGIYLSVLGHPK